MNIPGLYQVPELNNLNLNFGLTDIWTEIVSFTWLLTTNTSCDEAIYELKPPYIRKYKTYSRTKPCSYNHRLNNNNKKKIRTFIRIDSTQLTGLCIVYTATLHNEVASPGLVQCLYLLS